MNLAISDITFAVFVAPNHILNRAFTHPDGAIGSGICKILTGGNVAWVGAASSSVTLVAIAVERYYTVTCPLGSKGKLTKRKLKVSKRKEQQKVLVFVKLVLAGQNITAFGTWISYAIFYQLAQYALSAVPFLENVHFEGGFTTALNRLRSSMVRFLCLVSFVFMFPLF